MADVSVPTTRSMGEAFKSGLYGAGGGVLFGLAQKFLGAGWIGGLAGILLAGSMIKGDEGQDIATTLGVLTGLSLTGGNPAAGGTLFAPAASNYEGV